MPNIERINDDGQAKDEVREVDIDKFGDCYDPRAYRRVKEVDYMIDPDHDGE